jgi:hypothetical protein
MITEATRTLEPLVVCRKLTEPQKEAIGVALRQINQAIAAKPALDTNEMYDLRAGCFRRSTAGRGFDGPGQGERPVVSVNWHYNRCTVY